MPGIGDPRGGSSSCDGVGFDEISSAQFHLRPPVDHIQDPGCSRMHDCLLAIDYGVPFFLHH